MGVVIEICVKYPKGVRYLTHINIRVQFYCIIPIPGMVLYYTCMCCLYIIIRAPCSKLLVALWTLVLVVSRLSRTVQHGISPWANRAHSRSRAQEVAPRLTVTSPAGLTVLLHCYVTNTTTTKLASLLIRYSIRHSTRRSQ